MALVKLPDGQIVNKDLVVSVRAGEDIAGGPEVRILIRGEEPVSIPCGSKEARDDMLAKVAETLGL